MDARTLLTFEESLERCGRDREFLDRFYERFMASSPKVREKFANTDFVRQKRALRASFHFMLLAAEDQETGPKRYLEHLAERHSVRDLDIGAELYDLWLDSLLETVQEVDGECSEEVLSAWERVMNVGIRYMVTRYHSG